jgi:hypothetical protein
MTVNKFLVFTAIVAAALAATPVHAGPVTDIFYNATGKFDRLRDNLFITEVDIQGTQGSVIVVYKGGQPIDPGQAVAIGMPADPLCMRKLIIQREFRAPITAPNPLDVCHPYIITVSGGPMTYTFSYSTFRH